MTFLGNEISMVSHFSRTKCIERLSALVLLATASICHAQFDKLVYERTAGDYLAKYVEFQGQEQDILNAKIDVGKARALGLDPAEYQDQLERMKAENMYSLFDGVAGMYSIWHESDLGMPGVPAEYRQSAILIDSCYFRYMIHLIGMWEFMSDETYSGVPTRWEVRASRQTNLDMANNLRDQAFVALNNPLSEIIDFMKGMSWEDRLPDSVFEISLDLGTDHIYYFTRKESKKFGSIELDEIYYVEVGASGLSGIEAVGSTEMQRDALVKALDAQYGPSVLPNPDYRSGADIHMKWILEDKHAWAEIRWWNKGSPNGTKLGFKVQQL